MIVYILVQAEPSLMPYIAIHSACFELDMQVRSFTGYKYSL